GHRGRSFRGGDRTAFGPRSLHPLRPDRRHVLPAGHRRSTRAHRPSPRGLRALSSRRLGHGHPRGGVPRRRGHRGGPQRPARHRPARQVRAPAGQGRADVRELRHDRGPREAHRRGSGGRPPHASRPGV
ncbi:MAG: hypothetical protein AVDCRST_MAG10-328, partial [uncultured Acidimicrobiales bacterium]